MINIKNAQYTRLKTYAPFSALCTNSGTVEVNSQPTAFPYTSFVQKDNMPLAQSIDSGSKENHVQPMIQIDIYMNNNDMYKAEQVAEQADALMQIDGWQRTFGYQPTPTAWTGIVRLTARYTAIIKQNAPNEFTVI